MGKTSHVLVVGGGPGGSTTAALLAKAGIRVTLLEREQFPRYHIGESLLASGLSTLRLSGAYDAVAAHGFQVKRGGFFEWQDDVWRLNWPELVDAEAWSWQVDRAAFDDILLRNAAAQGVEVIEQATVEEVVFDSDDRPIAVEWTKAGDDQPRTTSFDFLVDASGRAGLLSRRHFNMRRPLPDLQNIAIWSYWTGARLHPESPEGAINVVSTPEGGWFWHIPLADGRFSVGYVIAADRAARMRAEHGSNAAYYHHAIRTSPGMTRRLEGAQQVADVRAEQDYSYVSERFRGPGYAIVGDAAAFLDPLLSTGVHLATYGGLTAAAAIATSLRGEMPEAEALDFYEYTVRRAFSRFLSLVTRMYRDYIDSAEYFSHARRLTNERADDTSQESFTRISAGLTDLVETSGQRERVGSDTIVAEVETREIDHPDANIRYMGGLDMSAVWNHWRDPLGRDSEMGDTRITTEPVLGLTRRPRTDAEIDAVARPVVPPTGGGSH